MVKKIILLGLGLLPLLLKAQLVLTAQLPSAGFVQKDQLWNFILINNKEDILDVNIQMNLQDAATGQVVLSASTGNMLIGKGVKIVASKDIQPITYNYNVPDLTGNYLPMGAYIACYQVNSNNGKGDPLAQECIRFNIDPLSPPLLNTPADKSEVESPYPQFTWMPPSPYDMFTNLSYDLLLTEVLEGQSAVEAIQYNTPVYAKSNITQPYESYASSFTRLDTGKIYAWQVVARNGLSYAAKTEVWTFKLKQEHKNPEKEYSTYILLDNTVKGTYAIKNNILHVKYFSFAVLYETMITFSDENGKLVKQIKGKIQPGDNYFDFNIGNDFQRGKIYIITITDAAKKQHSLRFSINKN